MCLQCGHNFTKSALEALFRHHPSGHNHYGGGAQKCCPVCKADVHLVPSSPPDSSADAPSSFRLATNVVLRDTIERLYPHVLRRRAVEDIQVRPW